MKRLRWLLPAPVLSLALWAMWLMLNESASVGHVLLGALVAVVVPGFTERLRPNPPRLRNIGILLRLAAVVLADIVNSNVQVARRVLGPESAIKPRFFWVPLDIRDAHGVVMLASVVTMTPGTLSALLSDDRRHLLVHSFDCPDDPAEQALIADIKQRYEAPLIAVFDTPPARKEPPT